MSSAASCVDVYHLPRGGTIVRTAVGLVQFGAPPETIKDSIGLGLGVPTIYVLPTAWFSRRRGVTCAELEFPAYYNYFLHGRKLVAVCDEEGRRRLHAVLREALLGPESYEKLARDFDASVPPDARPNLAAECEYFRAGVRLVWVADPGARTVDVYTAPDQVTRLTEADTLDGGGVLPGFTLPLRDWFAELDRHG